MTFSGDDNLLLPGITIERATDADLDTFVEIHEEVARWLWDQGIRQWRPGVFQKAWLRGRLERGELYLARRGGEAVGTVTLQWSDEYTWGVRPPDAGYIHGLRVRRNAAGQGIGRAMLGWAEREIARAVRPFARLDCIATNPTLCAYYLAAGYTRATDLEVEGAEKVSLARFEKRLLPEPVVRTSQDTLNIRRATPDDATPIAAIHDDTMRWAFARGCRSRAPLDLDMLRADARERIARHEVFVATADETPIATLALTWDDDHLWSALPGDAGYVYAFAVMRAFAGQDVGRAMLRWAAGYATAMGKRWLRLECDADNPRLCAYYERSGFTFRGEAERGARVLVRYEKAV